MVARAEREYGYALSIFHGMNFIKRLTMAKIRNSQIFPA